jgi:hypothetical protein
MQEDYEMVDPVAVNVSTEVERAPLVQQRMVRFHFFLVLITVNSTPAPHTPPPASATSGTPI